jgi:hypothetical protein
MKALTIILATSTLAILLHTDLLCQHSLRAAEDSASSNQNQYQCVLDSAYSGILDVSANPTLIINGDSSYSISQLRTLEIDWQTSTLQQRAFSGVPVAALDNPRVLDSIISKAKMLEFGVQEVKNIRITLENGGSRTFDPVTNISPEHFAFTTSANGRNVSAILYTKKVVRPFIEINGMQVCRSLYGIGPIGNDSTKWDGPLNHLRFGK